MFAYNVINTVGFISTSLCINTIMFTCAKTLNLVKYITSSNTENKYDAINMLLYTTDIKNKVAKIHKLILNIDNTILKDCIKMAINDLHESIHEINVILEEYINIKKYHDTLYFNYLRNMDYTKSLKDLNLTINLFNLRFDDFVKIVTVVKYITY
jgi:phosphoribosylaminoimidazole (AIR) synthetase